MDTEGYYGESFYDWCQRTGNQSFLLRWDYELNDVDPHNVAKSSPGNFYFKCEEGLHPIEKKNLNRIFRSQRIPECNYCNSFGVWCETNHRQDLLDRWDYEKNNCTPYEIPKATHQKMYFKCPTGKHESELKIIYDLITQPGSSRCIQCDSIGQWGLDTFGEDFYDVFWSELNSVDPMKIAKRSNKHIMIRCDKTDYHKDYDTTCDRFFKGQRCPYCAGKRVDINDSLGMLYPESLDQWVQKDSTPYDYLPNSNVSVYWNCSIHGQYKQIIQRHVVGDLLCPKCARLTNESRLQKKVREYLESMNLTVKHEFECNIIAKNEESRRPLPYDNEVVDYKLIIEVHGSQHYKPCEWFDHSRGDYTPETYLEHRQYLDRFKKNYAVKEGYQYLEIPYWTNDKKQTWKKLIDDKITSIVT